MKLNNDGFKSSFAEALRLAKKDKKRIKDIRKSRSRNIKESRSRNIRKSRSRKIKRSRKIRRKSIKNKKKSKKKKTKKKSKKHFGFGNEMKQMLYEGTMVRYIVTSSNVLGSNNDIDMESEKKYTVKIYVEHSIEPNIIVILSPNDKVKVNDTITTYNLTFCEFVRFLKTLDQKLTNLIVKIILYDVSPYYIKALTVCDSDKEYTGPCDMKKWYSYLGIDENSNKSQINKSFRKLALLYHPDKCTLPKSECKEKYECISKAKDYGLEILEI